MMMRSASRITIGLAAMLVVQSGLAQPPALPPGLSGGDTPTLPAGLSSGPASPSLPPGLMSDASPVAEEKDDWEDEDEPVAEYSGFWEHRLGIRLQSTSLHPQTSINESRLHVALDKHFDKWAIETGFDLLYDAEADTHEIDLEEGQGWFDLRKLSLYWKLSPSMDLRVGRQVLTWGTGDLVFLNDLFPKDWRFWLGRDAEYMKDPSDAMKLSWYNDFVNVDLVYTPRFDADRFITGERISFFNDNLGRRVGQADIIRTDKPDDWFEDDEIALRLYRNLNGMELALYGYDGFFKSPAGSNQATGRFTFPGLRTLGASLRTPLGAGIFNLEVAHWQSKDDRDGDDPLVRNGENRYLLGYEWEAAADFTVGLQYYAEHMHDHGRYKATLPAGSIVKDEVHEIFTVRLTHFMLNQNLKLSWFSYYSPDNGDFYARPEVNYKIDDSWTVEAGGTWFEVQKNEPHAFFGQLKYNSNIYLMVRYSFAGEIN